MGEGLAAGVFAGHATICVAAVLLAWRFVPLARAAAHGPKTRELVDACLLLPFSVLLVSAVVIAEAVYYSSARILLDHGYNLWQAYPAVWILRLSVAFVILSHMPAYWLWRGMNARRARKASFRDIGWLSAVYLCTFAAVW
ncbi:MAG: hypothetical protein AAF415_12980 [Pseudomonadota bacterium]